jgi:hypothetical protein
MKTVVAFLAGLVFLTGCTSFRMINVTSSPPGASVYSARGLSECGTIFRRFKPYDNVKGTCKGVTPVTYAASRYGYENARVVWPDGEDSGWEQRPTSSFKDCNIAFVKRNNVSLAVAPAVIQSPSANDVQRLPDQGNISDRLKKLKDLKDSGSISDSEYETQRKVLVEKL